MCKFYAKGDRIYGPGDNMFVMETKHVEKTLERLNAKLLKIHRLQKSWAQIDGRINYVNWDGHGNDWS